MTLSEQDLHPEKLLGCVLGDRYKLERVLGAGAMGAVYYATADGSEEFAVKVMHQELATPELEKRLLREAKIGTGLDSPHLMPVLDSGRDHDGRLFLVMPLLAGFDAASLLERVGPLAPEIAVRLVVQACRGLEAAHAAGIIHRDVKPSNIYLDTKDDVVTIRVLDFGVAKRPEMYDDTALTRTGTSLGSPLYMSPEQIRDATKVDARTDVWGIAVTLYELLCGTPPHGDAQSLPELLIGICDNDARWLQLRAPWVSPKLAQVVHSGLSRALETRSASAAEFADKLLPFTGERTTLRPSDLKPISAELRSQVAETFAQAGMSIDVSLAAESDDPLVGKVIDGKYELLRLLGRGGMGNVYEAHGPNGELVAVKLIAPAQAGKSDSVTNRFLREARAARSINSPHVVHTSDAGQDTVTKAPYIVMERLHGVDLSTVIQRHGALAPVPVVRLFIQAARGIAAAHAEGVIHRDIKPANIFVSTDPETGQVTAKVCDFGVAKRLPLDGDISTHELTQTGGLLGSPIYMSPEQARNAKHVDFRSDIWSLAISLRHALTGRRPWAECTSLGEVIMAIYAKDMPHLQVVAPWIESDLADVLKSALTREPEQRLASMEELIAALLPFAEGRETLTRDELVGLSSELAQYEAPRSPEARLAITATAAASVDTAPDRTVSESQSTKPRTALWAGVALVLAITGVAVAMNWGGREPTEAVNSAAALTDESEMKTAMLGIKPVDAEVRVNEELATLRDGALELSGKAGDTFKVVVLKGEARTERTVVMTRDGQIAPSLVELALPEMPKVTPAPSASLEPTAPSVAAPRARPQPRPGSKPATTPTPAPKPAAKPTPKPAGAIAPVDTW